MSPLVTQAPDTQTQWFPDWLVELNLGGGVIRRYAYSGDLDALTGSVVAYDGRLVSEPSVERGLSDELWGLVAIQDVTLELSNARGELTADYLAGYQSKLVTLTRYDRVSADWTVEFTGLISRAALGRALVRLDCQNVDKAALEDMVPKGIVTTASWPRARDCVGQVIPVVLGNVPRVPILCVDEHLPSNIFGYVVARGSMSVTGLYRNGPNDTLYPINFSECYQIGGTPATSWAAATRTDLYSGYTGVQFILRQADFNNSLHKIYADVSNPDGTSRNPVYMAAYMLGDPAWGCGQPIDWASMNASATLVPGLLCDGAMLEQRQAREWLSELLMMRGMRLSMTALGWSITVDTPATTRQLIAQDGLDDGERNLLSVGERTGPSLDDTIKNLIIKYRLSLIKEEKRTSQYLFEAGYAVNTTKGKDRIFEHNFIRSHETAARVAQYLGQRLKWDQERVDVELGQQARHLREGHIIGLLDPTLGYTSATDLEVFQTSKTLARVRVQLRGWSDTLYTYTPGLLPADDITGTEQDVSRVNPPPASGLAFASATTVMTSDGQISARMIYSFTTTTSANFKQAILRYRVAGTSLWSNGGTTQTKGATSAVVEGLLAGTPYDISVIVENPFGLFSAGNPELLNQTTPGNASMPSPVTGLSYSASGTRVATDGHVTAWAQLSYTTPAGQFKYAEARYKQFGTVNWIDSARHDATGATTMRVDGLLPGVQYDYTVRVIGVLERVSTGDPLLVGITSATDASVPDAPTAMSAFQLSGSRVVEIHVGGSTPIDWNVTLLYRNTVPNFTSPPAPLITFGKKHNFHDENVTYGQQYWYWAKFQDNSNNVGPLGVISAGVTVQRVQTPDINPGAVTTPTIATGNVTTSVFDTDSTSQSTTSTGFVAYTNNALSLNVSSTASVILVMLTADLRVLQSSGITGYAAGAMGLRIAGADSIAQEGWMWLPSGTAGMFPVTITLLDGPGRSGPTTYQCMFRSVVGGTTTDVFTPVLQVTELKR